MRKDKESARHLRLSGKSYKEIYEILRVPKSTLSGWFGGEGWSDKIRVRLTTTAREGHIVRLAELSRIRGKHLSRVYENARIEARNDLKNLKYNPLFISGLMLYWGEGDKLSKQVVKLTNTDPAMLRLFVSFLENACRIQIEKIRAQVLIYPDLNEKECRNYWSLECGVSIDRFIKSSLIQGRHKSRRLPYGVCMVYVSSTYFKVKVLEWLAALPEELMNREYYENI